MFYSLQIYFEHLKKKNQFEWGAYEDLDLWSMEVFILS